MVLAMAPERIGRPPASGPRATIANKLQGKALRRTCDELLLPDALSGASLQGQCWIANVRIAFVPATVAVEYDHAD